MKKFLSVFLIVVLCLLTACNKNPDPSDKNVTPSPSTDITNVVTPSDGPTQQVTYPKASNKIVWQLNVVGGPAADNVDEVNRLLMEKEYDCEIEFVRAYPEPSKNREWLEQYESEHQTCDIINGGIWETENLLYLKQQQYALEMFTPLNDYLDNTEEGRKLKDLFGETELSCKSFGDTVYELPQLLSNESLVTGSFLYFPDCYADLFTDYDDVLAIVEPVYVYFAVFYGRRAVCLPCDLVNEMLVLNFVCCRTRYCNSVVFKACTYCSASAGGKQTILVREGDSCADGTGNVVDDT